MIININLNDVTKRKGINPRSIIAQRYTYYSPERLKEIYDKAESRVLFTEMIMD